MRFKFNMYVRTWFGYCNIIRASHANFLVHLFFQVMIALFHHYLVELFPGCERLSCLQILGFST